MRTITDIFADPASAAQELREASALLDHVATSADVSVGLKRSAAFYRDALDLHALYHHRQAELVAEAGKFKSPALEPFNDLKAAFERARQS